MAKLTKRDLAIIGGLAGVADFLAEGKLSAPLSRALKRAAIAAGKKAIFTAPAAARVAQASALRGAGTVARVGAMVAMRHPYIAAGAVIYVAAKNRNQIADLIRDGYDVVQDVAQTRQDFIERNPEQFIDLPLVGPVRPIGGVLTPKRRKSTYNTSVSKGMKAIKKSTSYGKKGVLNSPKKAFAFVAKTVSKLRRGKKVPNKGASGVIKRALPGISKIEVRK